MREGERARGQGREREREEEAEVEKQRRVQQGARTDGGKVGEGRKEGKRGGDGK